MPSVRVAQRWTKATGTDYPKPHPASVVSLPQENLLPSCRCGFVENGDGNNPEDPRLVGVDTTRVRSRV